MTPTRKEWASLLVLCASVILVFGFGAPNLGFYYEDSGFMTQLPAANLSTLWRLFLHGSVPGRNLYIIWQVLLYKLVGNPALHLMALHVIQSFIDAVIVAVFFVVLRRLRASSAASFIAAGMFAFWPTHGETHYWTPGTPYNLSTLFLLLFILTSTRILQPAAASLWLWILDGFFFASALFTYDQLVIFIGLLLLLRISILIVRSPKRALTIVAEHAFPLLLSGLYFYLKATASIGDGPTLTHQTWVNFWPNVYQVFRQNFGLGWIESSRPLYDHAVGWDMRLSALAAMVVTATSLVFLRVSKAMPARSLLLLLAGAAFFVLTYLPVVLWYLSRRHNFLPSIGLFACVAALVDLFFWAVRFNVFKAVPVLAAGLAVFVFAAVGRGESRNWEKSFAAKRQLYADLTENIKGSEILVLQGFPVLLGPTEVILPHDANFGPKLVYKQDDIAAFRLGDVSSSPAQEGIFINTAARFYAPDSISYYETNHLLIVSFLKWLDDNRFAYKILDRHDDPTYKILDAERSDYKGPFALDSAAIAPQGSNAVISLDVSSGLQPGSHLVMTLSVEGSSGLEEWGRRESEGFLNRSPVLLDSSEGSNEAGRQAGDGIHFKGRILLYGFPGDKKTQIHFLAVGEHGVTKHLSDWDIPIASSHAVSKAE
jgi:hypothetical protein